MNVHQFLCFGLIEIFNVVTELTGDIFLMASEQRPASLLQRELKLTLDAAGNMFLRKEQIKISKWDQTHETK